MISALTSRKFRLFSIGISALGAVILCNLKRFSKRAKRLEVSLDTHVAKDEKRGTHRCLPQRGIACDEESNAELDLNAVCEQVDHLDVDVGEVEEKLFTSN